MNGIINVLKPPGMTSHDIVNYIRLLKGIKKVGHTGTLDPGAAGVLPVCVGKATRVAEYLISYDKCYRAECTLGASTDTQDSFGRVLEVRDASCLAVGDIEAMLMTFVGSQEQIVPMFSAVKVQGKKLYELARAGQRLEREARRINVYSIKLLDYEDLGTPAPRVLFEVTCSKGTYVRTICHDLGQRLGYGGYMSFLIRTRVGVFDLSKSVTLEELKEYADKGLLNRAMLPIDLVLSDMVAVQVRESAVAAVKAGNRLYLPGIKEMPGCLAEDQIVRLRSGDKLLALARVMSEEKEGITKYIFQPFKVLV
jgi:tRNA pseudouridine55 synthase